jgi:hypothetical protein
VWSCGKLSFDPYNTLTEEGWLGGYYITMGFPGSIKMTEQKNNKTDLHLLVAVFQFFSNALLPVDTFTSIRWKENLVTLIVDFQNSGNGNLKNTIR